MSNPNFLTANTSGIELMPGVNDTAVGYDVNRVIQALNGINLIPITTGNLTVSGTLNVSGLATLSGGISMANQTIVGPITINPGPLTVSTGGTITNGPNSFTPLTGTNIGQLFVKATDATANDFTSLDFGNTGQTQPIARIGIKYTGSGSEFHFGTSNNYANGITTDAVQIGVTGTLVSASDIMSGGRILLSPAVSKIVPGATSISHRNNADNADNLLINDAGDATMRSSLSIPPSTGGTMAATSYGTVPVKIAEVALNASQTPVTFSSIPSGFRALKVYIYAKTDAAGVSVDVIYTRFNNDSTSNYDLERLTVSGSGAASSTELLGTANTYSGFTGGASSTAGYFGSTEITIPMYAGTTGNKVLFWQSGAGGTNLTGVQFSGSGMVKWRTVGTAINRLDFVSSNAANFIAGSVFVLYGIP